MDPPSAKTQQQWSKCQSGNSLLEADNSSGYCTSAATAGASATVTSSSPSSSSSLFSDASSSCTTIDQDMADIEYPVSPWSPPGKKTRSQLRMIPTGNKTAFLQVSLFSQPRLSMFAHCHRSYSTTTALAKPKTQTTSYQQQARKAVDQSLAFWCQDCRLLSTRRCLLGGPPNPRSETINTSAATPSGCTRRTRASPNLP